MRVSNEELNKICEKYNTDRLWSWSRVNCVHNSLYEYFLKYILHAKEDRDDSIYKVTGGISHDIIEKFYNGEIAYEQMVEEFKDGWLTAFDIAELKFNRSDSTKNDSIAEKYYYDLENFFKTHQKISYKVQLEQFITVKIGEEYYQGYIDCCFKDKEENYVILDWKTSSIYKGAKAQNECGQLCMYAMALHQKGVPYEKIKIAWNFLKYQSVTVEAKNGTKKVREIERYELGEKLQANAKMWLKHFGYEDELIEYLDALAQTNDITVLPKEVQEKFELADCYVYVDLTEELIKHWESYIIETTKMIRDKEAEYEINKDEHIWWEDEESVASQSYYFSNLCGYSAHLHKPYAAYLDKLTAEKNGDLLGSTKKNEDEYDENDMSWLNDI